MLHFHPTGLLHAPPRPTRSSSRGPAVSPPARALALGVFLIGACAIVACPPALALPSFARQTKLACNGCHVQFPVLNDIGRQFKLDGYTLIDRPTIEEKDESGRKTLDLPLPAMLSAMLQADFTHTGAPEPGRENDQVELPDQMSLFLAGRIAPKVGGFVQVTYAGADDEFGFDNTDVRFADRGTVAGTDIVYGLSLNNNPTVTDPWNSLPAWGYPYASSPSAPAPAAGPLLAGGLAQEVAGVNAYALIDGLVYAEAGVYGAAPLGVDRPLAPAGNLSGAAPYWRLAVQRTWGANHFMLGHAGLYAAVDPGAGATRSRFTDIAFDFQYQRSLGHDALQLQGSWIYERARYDSAAGVARFGTGHLHRLSADATYFLGQKLSFTLSPFWITGSEDSVLYPVAPVEGSADGTPDSSGLILEASYNPWMNTRLTAQYTAYFDFNGGSRGYEGFRSRRQ